MKSSALLAVLALSGTALTADPVPLLSWNFDEGGGDYATNLGSANEANLYLVGPAGDKINGFSSDAQGVSGKPGDYAFDLSSATGMGATTPNSTGPTAVVWSNSSGLASLSGLSSFTLTGWIKPETTITAAARIVATNVIALMAGVDDRLTIQVNGKNSPVQSEPLYRDVGSWIFFAVSYDGTRTTDNVTYYVGDPAANSLITAGTATLEAGKVKPFAGQFLLGNNSINTPPNRPFKGLMDNIAIYGSMNDASGALPLEKIETIRAAAIR
ncbi:MAG: LamG-like jellyroll fold domain-containing protein [Opitutaceae bacterium]|jgi:hypothetical protein